LIACVNYLNDNGKHVDRNKLFRTFFRTFFRTCFRARFCSRLRFGFLLG
jgi:hypothetical protein